MFLTILWLVVTKTLQVMVLFIETDIIG